MDAEAVTELDAWKELVKTTGFQLLQKRARLEWGADGYGRKLKLAVEDAKKNGIDLERAIDGVDAASNAITELMSFPELRIEQLTDSTTKRAFWDKRRA